MFSFLKFFKKRKEENKIVVEEPINKSYVVLPVTEFKNNTNDDKLYFFDNKSNEKYAIVASTSDALNVVSIVEKEQLNEYLSNIGFNIDISLLEEQKEEKSVEELVEKPVEKIEENIKTVIIEKPVEKPKNQLIANMMSIAEQIKNKRKPTMAAPKPIKVQKYAHYKKALICVDAEGNEYNVGPTTHAIIQFANRYQHIDPLFTPLNEKQIENKIREIFNKGSLSTDEMFHHRNAKREQARAKNVIWWVSGDVNFIVNLKEKTIITAELTGGHINYNNTPPRVIYQMCVEK